MCFVSSSSWNTATTAKCKLTPLKTAFELCFSFMTQTTNSQHYITYLFHLKASFTLTKAYKTEFICYRSRNLRPLKMGALCHRTPCTCLNPGLSTSVGSMRVRLVVVEPNDSVGQTKPNASPSPNHRPSQKK